MNLRIVTRKIANYLNRISYGATDDRYYSPGGSFYGGIPTTKSGALVSEQTAIQLAIVWCCIKILSEDSASLPLFLYRRLPNGGKEKAIDNRKFWLMHDQPNPEMTAMTFRETYCSHLVGWGNAYAEKEFGKGTIGSKDIKWLWPITPNRVLPERDRDTKKIVYRITIPGSGQPIWLPKRLVMHTPALGFNGLMGYSPIGILRETIGLGMTLEEFGERYFTNGSNMGGFLEHPKVLSDKARENLKTAIDAENTGLINSHRFMLLQEGMKFNKRTIPNNDAQFLESRKFQNIEIGSKIYRIPPHMYGEMDRATFCLPADVEILTERGSIPIIDVLKREKIWSVGKKGLELQKVKNLVCTGIDKILEIKTTNRTIRTNARHKILTRIKVSNPKSGVGGYQCIKWENKYIPAGDLKNGDTIITLDRLPESGLTTYMDRKVLSNGFLEFLGLLIGDGNVYKNLGVSIARAKNANYMDYYRKVIKQEFVSFGKYGNGKTRKNLKTYPVKLQEQERQTRFKSVLASEELEEMGFCGNARTKRIPNWIFGLTEELRLSFLRGYLDSDGAVDKKGRISYASVNKIMLSQARHLCMSCGIPVTNLRRQAIKTKLPNGKIFIGECFSFTCSDPGSNIRIGSHDLRYIKRMKNNKSFNKKDRNYPRYGGKDFNLKGCSMARIVSIKTQSEEPVYDLEVSGTHSFIANGIVVHNSNIEQQALDYVSKALRPWLVRLEQSYNMNLLTEEERGEGLFFEHLVDGLLRGDIKSRYEAYSIGRINKWLSADEIRSFENMNPIPDGRGKVYENPNITVNEPAEPPEARMDKVIESYKPMFLSVMQRIVNRETLAISKAIKSKLDKGRVLEFKSWLDTFYNESPEHIKNQILPLFVSFINIITDKEEKIFIDDCINKFVADHIKISKGMLGTEDVKNVLSKWGKTRANDYADLVPLTILKDYKSLSKEESNV